MSLNTVLRRLPIAIMLGVLCSCAPRMHPSIERADTELGAARANTAIAANAAVQLDEASALLDRAKNDWRKHHDEVEAEHVVYLTERKIQSAQAAALQKEAEIRTAALHGTRDDLRLQSQTRATLSAERKVVLLESEVLGLRRAITDFQTRETERGFEVTLGDVLFETDRSELKSGAARKLLPLITFLKDHPDREALVEVHTDNVGSSSYNKDLSERRAEAVRALFLAEGISASRVVAKGYGEQYPVASNADSSGRLQNRRVQIVITGAGASTLMPLQTPS